MRVLSVIIGHPLRKIGGAASAGLQLSQATADLVDLELAMMWDEDGEYELGNLRVKQLKATTPFGPFERFLPRIVLVPLYNSRIPELIEQGGYDLVHIHNLLPAFAAERVARACLRRGVPYVISSHGFNEQSRYASLNNFGWPKSLLADLAITAPFERVIRRASAILALSDCETEELAVLGIGPEKTHIVTNGVNEFYLEPPCAEDLSSTRRKFGIGEGPVILFMGSLHGYKGLDVFLSSLHQIEGRFEAVVAGFFKDESEKTALLNRAGITDQFKLTFTGRVSDSELRSLYNLATLFVYPTRGDTLPLVVLEAMACGRPVVSTTVGGIPYLVGPAEGILVPPDDPAAVAAAVNELLDDPARRESMGESAKARVRSEFRWAKAARKAVEAYEMVLGAAVGNRLMCTIFSALFGQELLVAA